MRAGAALVAPFLLGALASAQTGADADAARPALRAVWVDPATLSIDGDGAEWRASLEPDFSIERLEQFVEISGRAPGEYWSGADDASLRAWLGWNESDLVLYGEVYDEVASPDSSRWYQGDSLELFLDLVDWTATWGPDDYQLMLAPDWAERPWGVYPRAAQAMTASGASDGGFGGVEVVSKPFIGGYRFELRIPWRNFARYQARAGARLGFNFALCDRDHRGLLESYGTWTGEREVAQYADRRGVLTLAPRAQDAAAVGAPQAPGTVGSARSYLLLLLAALYGCALWTRRAWRTPRARRAGLWAGAVVLVAAVAIAFATRVARQSARAERRAEIETYWARFERLIASGVLGPREPDELLRDIEALLAGKSIPPLAAARVVHLVAKGDTLDPEQLTPRRGLRFAPIVGPARAPNGLTLAPGQSVSLSLAPATPVDALHLVTRVSDARYLRMAPDQLPILSLELRREGRAVAPSLEVRHRAELHFQEDDHVDRPGLEPVLYAPGGRRGRIHADGLLVKLQAAVEADELVVRHVGSTTTSYPVGIVAVSARAPDAAPVELGDLRASADGQWLWTGAQPSIAAEVTALGRTPKQPGLDPIAHDIVPAAEPIGTVHLRDVAPPPSTRFDFVPLAALAAAAPFLVALFAEWLATRRRIRGKLAAGFAVSSAVPLLALTLLLEASLREEHRARESERARDELVRAEQELERGARELEREAQRLLKIAELRRRIEGSFPETSEELVAWWGESDGALRLFERTGSDGRRTRVGTGPQWRQIPLAANLSTGLVRPWGQLLLCGVAQTAPGAGQPLSVAVARVPGLPGDSSGGELRLIGAGRDPAPQLADLEAAGAGEFRRAVWGPSGQDLVGVLAVTLRERGVAVLGDYTLTELLLAAGITALFTVLLFAGILTARLVGPIERLDLAVRRGAAGAVAPEVDDEIGTLTSAIRSYADDVAARVRQLETLQLAQGELSRRLDPDQAREAVLGFFARHSGAASLWLLWRGEAGEEPRVFGDGGRDLALPDSAGLLQRAVVAGEVLHFLDGGQASALSEFERVLIGPVRRVLCLPLIAAGETRGAILFGYSSDEARSDLAFLQAAASQSAIVFENARLYSQAVRDALTGFLTDPGFRQRVGEELQRAQSEPDAGVLMIHLRLTGQPRDDARAGERLREAARRMRLAVRGLGIFGRAGSADLKVALPWTQRAPNFDVTARRLVERVASGPWPDGEPVTGLFVAHAAWPDDGPSARFVMSVLEERLAEAQTGVPALDLVRLRALLPVDFVAVSPIMLQLLDTLRRIAEQDITVLITGETGAGKDRIAELVHEWSRRRAGPLVHIHCPSLSQTLIEDELFGHEKGAFTGAHTRRIGPFEYASGGTVVLDEIGGLSQAGQVALLRLLETREVTPLGATRPVPIDVRIVATTAQDLNAEVERGDFRGDLFFRLNVAQVSVPPLRLRRQALPDLVEAFVRRFNAGANRPITGVDPKVMDALFEYGWPGNVREFENVFAKAATLAAGGELAPEHFDLKSSGEERRRELSGAADGPLNERQERLLEGLAPGARVSSAELAERDGTSARTALRDLLDLVERGYLVREGSRRGTRFRRTPKPVTTRSGR